MGQLDGGRGGDIIGRILLGRCLVVARRWVAGEEVWGGAVVRQGWGHCGVVRGQFGRQPVLLAQGGLVARPLRHGDVLLLPVGVGLLVLPVVRGRDVDLNVNGVWEEPCK